MVFVGRTFQKMNRIEIFFAANSGDLSHEDMENMRADVSNAIAGNAIQVDHCPEHLRSEFRRMVVESVYQNRVSGQTFNSNDEIMPISGKSDPRRSNNSRL